MNTRTKVSSEVLTMVPFSAIRYIEDQHKNQGICAVGRYDEYGLGWCSSDLDRDLYTIFWTDAEELKVFITYDKSVETEQEVIDRFNELNNHLIYKSHIVGNNGLDFIKNRATIMVLYAKPKNDFQELKSVI